MLAHARVGDYFTRNCPRCRKQVLSRLSLRSVQLTGVQLVVPDVLVDVCEECDHMISIARESLPQLREAGVSK